MCGIAGFLSPSLSQKDLHSSTLAQHHRGPDSHGFFYDEQYNIGLAHNRLSIIDLSEAANQPMFSENEDYVCVFNGEIYNFQELRQRFPEYPYQTSSDTETLLALFTQFGTDIVNHLNGMFAIAIWDKRNEKLFLFRDRLGIKPLFYYSKDGEFMFSSELKGLKSMNKDLTISKDILAEYLHFGYIPEPHTIYQNTFKFPSGSFAEVDINGITITKYWDPADKITSSVIEDQASALALLEDGLQKSVRKRMISDVPLGVFLSGGIDSSLIAGIAASNSLQPINTFSIGFEEAHKNEAPFARKVAKHLNTNHEEFIVSQDLVKKEIESIVTSFDEPFADSSAFPTMLVSQLAREKVKVVLSGDGGDELFHGYGAYQWAQRLDNSLLHKLRTPISTLLNLGKQRHQRAAHVFKYRRKDDLRSHIFSQEQYLFSRKEISRLRNTDQYAELPQYSFDRTLTPAENQAFFDLNYYLKDDLLTKVDRSSMKFGLEARVPLLDHEVVELALNIAPELKIKDGESKYLLKQLLYKYVPQELFDRPKAGFSIPLNQWLLSDLAYLIDDYVLNGKLTDLGLDQKVIEKYVLDFRSGKQYLYNRVWLLVVLGMWYHYEQ